MMTISYITAEECIELLKNPNITVLDIRTADEYEEGHLPKAINIDIYDPEFTKKLETLEKDKTYLIYCLSGGRTEQAARMMAVLNFQDIIVLSGGIIAWTSKNLPLTT